MRQLFYLPALWYTLSMKAQITELIHKTLKSLDIEPGAFAVEHPEDFKNGDYSTNVAMAHAKKLSMNPRELAEKIAAELEKNKIKEIEKIEIAGPGFINFYLTAEFFANQTAEVLREENSAQNFGRNSILFGKKVMVEYTQPNPFKPFHIGHLMSNAIGESLSRIVEFSGAKTIRANYQGDIGPHVAKAIYGLMQNPIPASITKASDQAQYIGECYVKGNDAYESDANIKKEIDAINKKIYEKSDAEINKIYDWGRQVTLEAFEEIYKILDTKFDYYFFESEVAPDGVKIVKENTPKVFEESDGAIVFKAENYNPKLHTRVFITSQGLPTYETKELGLTKKKFELESPDISIVDTATEQADYMRVVMQAISVLYPELEGKLKHITHGMMRFAQGKMSSRLGNVVTGESLLRDSKNMVLEKMADRDFSDVEKNSIAEMVGVAAIKYSILRSTVGSDIIFDFEKSISFEGDSGPYLQYTLVRANSVLEKAKHPSGASASSLWQGSKNADREVFEIEKYLYQFPEVVERALSEYEPHHIATYLIELASSFNSFYANNKIIDDTDESSPYKIALTNSFAKVMQNGLWLLGIKVPEKM